MTRFRRLRNNAAIRNLVRETTLTADDVIQPFFIIEGDNKQEPIDSMPGIHRHSIDLLLKEVGQFRSVGGQAGLFFGIPDTDPTIASNQKLVKGIQEGGNEISLAQPVSTNSGSIPQYNGTSIRLSIDGDYSFIA